MAAYEKEIYNASGEKKKKTLNLGKLRVWEISFKYPYNDKRNIITNCTTTIHFYLYLSICKIQNSASSQIKQSKTKFAAIIDQGLKHRNEC